MEIAQKWLSSLFPSRCIVCQQTICQPAVNQNVEICLNCYQVLPHNKNCCIRCALPLLEEIDAEVLCGRCIKQLPHYDYAHSLFHYESEITRLIHQLKFKEKIHYARSLGELLLARLEDVITEHGKPDCIIAVPLHKKRLRKRGYNQSIEVARVIAKKKGISIDHQAVVKNKSTLPQSELSAKDRQRNIKNVFSIVEIKNYNHVLIIDDVVTTGSTINELSKVIKKAGVRKVGVLSIARAPLKN